MPVPEILTAAGFDRENPPALDRAKRPGTLSVKAVDALVAENAASFQGSRGRVAKGLLLLWHDHWEEAHHIAQSDEGEPDHDLLHAIIHRREGDFANSAYWFQEAGKNKAFEVAAARAEKLLVGNALRATVLPEGKWSSTGFLSAIRLDHSTGSEESRLGDRTPLLRALQAEEIIAFFETLAS
jgi:hypothetical protein